jgi:hypothetical protein
MSNFKVPQLFYTSEELINNDFSKHLLDQPVIRLSFDNTMIKGLSLKEDDTTSLTLYTLNMKQYIKVKLINSLVDYVFVLEDYVDTFKKEYLDS